MVIERTKRGSLFCERCALLANRLFYSPAARHHAELLSGSCIWDDETARGWCLRCIGLTRILFRARYCMTVGEPVQPDAQILWEQAEREYPNWPLFRPERRADPLADEVRRLVDELTTELLAGWEDA